MIEYAAGAYYSVASLLEDRTTGVLFAPAATTLRIFDQEDQVVSLFGALTWNVAQNFRINGSARYTHGKKSAHYRRIQGPLAATDGTGTEVANFRDEISNGRIDPAVSVEYDLTPDAMVYASYSQGSKSAGFQGAISNATLAAFSFRPEKSESWEAGTKLTFRGLGFLNLAAFYTDYTDQQVSVAVPTTSGSLAVSFFTGNVPAARVIGLEGEFSLRPASFLTLDGSFAWLPTAKFILFPNGPCYTLQPPNGALPGTCDLSGQRLGFAPEYSASLNATMSVPLGAGMTLRGTVSPIIQGDSWRDFVNDPVEFQDEFIKVDARLALSGPEDRWEVALVGKNLTDIMTIAYGNTAGLANATLDPASRTVTPDPPRSFSIQGRLRF